MAKAVADGAKSIHGVEVELSFQANPEQLAKADAIVIGMPTYHHDMTGDMKKLLEEISERGINIEGKVGAAFGSYGWSGEAPHLVLEIFENRFKMNVLKPPLLVEYTPDQKDLEKCRELGRTIAEQTLRFG